MPYLKFLALMTFNQLKYNLIYTGDSKPVKLPTMPYPVSAFPSYRRFL